MAFAPLLRGTLLALATSALLVTTAWSQGESESLEQRLARIERDHATRIQELENRYDAKIGELESTVEQLNDELEEANADSGETLFEAAVNSLVQRLEACGAVE